MLRLVLIAVLLAAACGSEANTQVDLSSTTTGGSESESGDEIDDPNTEVRQQAQEFADQQCLDDPELEEGVIEIVDPETQELAGRILADCAEVRSRD